MTTARFNAQAGPTARALDVIKTQHCAPPAFKPVADVKGEIACTKCRRPLRFTVLASSGRTTGRCSTLGCLNWSE
jgi:hypothetical protein